MGGRGSRFKDLSIEQEKEKYWTDYGDADQDLETDVQNGLTKNLKDSNIIVCDSLKNLDNAVVESNLKQIKDLTHEFSGIVSPNLDDECIKIRSFKMNRIRIATGTKSPEYEILALFAPIKKQICFNERSIKDLESLKSLVKHSQEVGHSVKVDNGKESVYVITHEYGHFLENCIIEKRIQQDVRAWAKFKTNVSEMQKMRIAEAESIRTKIKEIATKKYKASEGQLKPSEYGDKSPFEWFAEVFAETKLHTTNKPLVKAMKEYLKGEF